MISHMMQQQALRMTRPLHLIFTLISHSPLHWIQVCHMFLPLVMSLMWGLTVNLMGREKGKSIEVSVGIPTSGSSRIYGLKLRVTTIYDNKVCGMQQRSAFTSGACWDSKHHQRQSGTNYLPGQVEHWGKLRFKSDTEHGRSCWAHEAVKETYRDALFARLEHVINEFEHDPG